MCKSPKPKKHLTKGLSIPEVLYNQTMVLAKKESRPFSFIVRRAIERELNEKYLTPVRAPEESDDLIPITKLAEMLHLSVSRVRTRSRNKQDPIGAARSKVGKQKPIHFHRSLLGDLLPKKAG